MFMYKIKLNKSFHKGQNGMAFAYISSSKYFGAGYFSLSALSKTTDIVYFYCPDKPTAQLLRQSVPSAIYVKQSEIKKILKTTDVGLIGPGLTELNKNILFLIKKSKVSLVLDALAISKLNYFKNQQTLITPHAGEFKKYFSKEPTIPNLKKIAKQFNTSILLKGQTDIIINEHQKITKNKRSCAILTRGGTGDILAGLCAGLSIKLGFEKACLKSLDILVKAGKSAYKNKGYLINSSDILNELKE